VKCHKKLDLAKDKYPPIFTTRIVELARASGLVGVGATPIGSRRKPSVKQNAFQVA
jgi:hypothetical protein